MGYSWCEIAGCAGFSLHSFPRCPNDSSYRVYPSNASALLLASYSLLCSLCPVSAVRMSSSEPTAG